MFRILCKFEGEVEMATSDKQRELDKIKWDKSVMLGFDACGSFDYCKCCDKALENPCENAHNKYYNIPTENNHELVVEIENNEIKEVEKKSKTTTSKKSSSKSTATKKSSAPKKSTTKSSANTSAKKTTKKSK